MSGRKITVVEKGEHRHLLEGAREADSLRREIEERERRARESVLIEFRPVIEELQRKFALTDGELNRLKTKLSVKEAQFKKIVEEQRREIMRIINDQSGKISSAIEEIKNSLREQDRRIGQIEEGILEITKGIKNQEAFAQNLLRDVNIVFNEISNLSHERFAPGKMDLHRLQLQIQEENIRGANYQAAIAGIQSLYLELVRTKREIYQKERDYLLKWGKLLEELYSLKERTELELDFEWIEGDRKADFWVYGKLEELKRSVSSLIEELRRNKDNWTEKELDLVEEKIENIRGNIDQLIDKSITNAYLSYERKRLALSIEYSAKEQGFQWEEKKGYLDGDPRKDFLIVLRDALDDRLIVRIFKGNGANHAEVNLYPCRGVRDINIQKESLRKILTSVKGNRGVIKEEPLPDGELKKRIEKVGSND
jgi:hypothetical protein